MIQAQIGKPFQAVLEGEASGLVGTIGVRVRRLSDETDAVARTTSGIVESPTGSGVYVATIPSTPGPSGVEYLVLWDAVSGGTPLTPDKVFTEELQVFSGPVPVSVPSGPNYTTPEALREELDVDSTVLPDAAADKLIAQAEDQIDEELGAWPIQPDTGRKIAQGWVEDWRWTKLSRATTLLAARFYNDPKILDGQQYRSIRGPDFAVSDPLTGKFGEDVAALLNQSKLRRLTTQTGIGLGGRGGRPPWFDFAYNDTSWDYEPSPLPIQPSTP